MFVFSALKPSLCITQWLPLPPRIRLWLGACVQGCAPAAHARPFPEAGRGGRRGGAGSRGAAWAMGQRLGLGQ